MAVGVRLVPTAARTSLHVVGCENTGRLGVLPFARMVGNGAVEVGGNYAADGAGAKKRPGGG